LYLVHCCPATDGAVYLVQICATVHCPESIRVCFLNFLVIPSHANPINGIDLTTPSEIAASQIQKQKYS
jgi:hypothetical protein